jgi:arylsulfatase A-like enzyme
MTQPNVLWICTDQQRWDTLSCLGHPGASTPNFDKLAASGVNFTRAYCQSPICTPSRASFLSGMYPIANQVQRNGNDHYPDDLPLLPRMMQDAGYTTGLIGKLHLSRAEGVAETLPEGAYSEVYWSHHPDPDWTYGHDYRDWLLEKGADPEALFANQKGAVREGLPVEFHETTWAGSRAKDFIKRNAAKPWLLSINVFDPHPPFDPPRAYMEQFDPEEMPAPVFDERDLAQHAKLAGKVDQQAQKVIDPRNRTQSSTANDGPSHARPPDQMDALEIRAAYHAMIKQVDDMVGELCDLLEETGQRENTLVIFMSDHGEMLGDHGLLYKGCRFYDGLVRVPLIVSHPASVRPARRADDLVELVDLPQTILEFCQIPKDPQMQGASLYPFLTGKVDTLERRFVTSEYFDAIRYPGSVGFALAACISTVATSFACTTMLGLENFSINTWIRMSSTTFGTSQAVKTCVMS